MEWLELILNSYPIYLMSVVIAESSHPQYLSIYRVPGGRRALRILLPPGVFPPATLLGPPVPMLKALAPLPPPAAPSIAVGVTPKPVLAPNPGVDVVAAGAKSGVGLGAGTAFQRPNFVAAKAESFRSGGTRRTEACGGSGRRRGASETNRACGLAHITKAKASSGYTERK
jgi:hypothetical protein